MNKKELPKLPRGMGAYDWYKDDLIRYRKRVRYEEEFSDISVYGETIQECNRKMAIKENEFVKLKKKELVNLKTRTLEDGMNNWLYNYKIHEVKATSFDRMESTYKTHVVNKDIGNMQEKNVTSDDIQKFIVNEKSYNNRPLSYSSRKKIYELFSQYFRFLYSDNPNIDPMRKVTKPKKDDEEIVEEELTIYEDDEMYKIHELAFQEYIIGVHGYKHGLLVDFLMWTFLRVNECLALRWKDIDFKEETINVVRQVSDIVNRDEDSSDKRKKIITEPKWHSKRKFKMVKPAVEAITEYKRLYGQDRSGDDLVFPNKDDEPLVVSRVKQTHEAMAIELGFTKCLTTHDLRHTGISFMLRNGAPVEVVSKMAGHKNISVTYETYYSVINKQKNDAVDALNKKLFSKKKDTSD